MEILCFKTENVRLDTCILISLNKTSGIISADVLCCLWQTAMSSSERQEPTPWTGMGGVTNYHRCTPKLLVKKMSPFVTSSAVNYHWWCRKSCSAKLICMYLTSNVLSKNKEFSSRWRRHSCCNGFTTNQLYQWFDTDIGDRVSLSTGVPPSQAIISDLLNANKKGEEAYKNFIQTQLDDSKQNFHDKMSKLNL